MHLEIRNVNARRPDFKLVGVRPGETKFAAGACLDDGRAMTGSPRPFNRPWRILPLLDIPW